MSATLGNVLSQPVALLGEYSPPSGSPVGSTAGTGAETRTRPSESSPEVSASWCRQHHREHHQRTPLDNGRMKVHCTLCGRKFIRERQVTYLVRGC
jgi:hypothetical protein